MRKTALLLVLGGAIALTAAGCAIAADPAPTMPATNASESVDSTDATKGKALFLRCRTCHEVNKNVTGGSEHRTGPNLYGIFGAPAGATDASYEYSAGLKNSRITWTEDTLSKWIEDPDGLVPETTMAFPGIASADDRRALIGYLKSIAR